MKAAGEPSPGAFAARRALALVVLAYLLFTGGSVTLLMLVGGWTFLVLPGIAGLLYLALDLFRASLPLFVFMPPLAVVMAREGLILWHTAFGTLVTAWLIALVRGRVQVPAHYLGVYAAFLGTVALSLVFGVDRRLYLPVEAVPSHIQEHVVESLLMSLTAVLLIPAVTNRRQLRRLAWAIVLAGVGYTATLFFEIFETSAPELGVTILDVSRPAGVFTTPHHAGLFTIFYLLVATALFASERNHTRRVFLAGSAALFLSGIYATRSRTTWVTLTLLILLVMWQELPELRRRVRFSHAYIAGVVVVLGAGVVLGRVFQVDPWGPTMRELPPFWEGRIALAKLGLELFLESPVTGVGLGNSILLIPQQLIPFGYSGPGIHTQFAGQLAETGVLGFAAFLLIVGVSVLHFSRAVHAARSEGDAELYYLTRAFFLGLWAVLITSLVHAGIGDRLFWALVAMAFVTRRLATGGGRDVAHRAEPNRTSTPLPLQPQSA